MKILYSIIYLTIGVVTVYFLSHIVKEKSKKTFFLKIQLVVFVCGQSLLNLSFLAGWISVIANSLCASDI